MVLIMSMVGDWPRAAARASRGAHLVAVPALKVLEKVVGLDLHRRCSAATAGQSQGQGQGQGHGHVGGGGRAEKGGGESSAQSP